MIPGRKIGGAQVFRVKILIVFFQERTHQHHMAGARLLEFLVASGGCLEAIVVPGTALLESYDGARTCFAWKFLWYQESQERHQKEHAPA